MVGHVVVISNDIIPGMGAPVAAPGLRAWGLAQGLSAHGLHTTVLIPRHVAARQRVGDLPAVAPPGAIVLPHSRYGEYLGMAKPSMVVMTNSNAFDLIPRKRAFRLVMDFFAPKLLEAQAHGQQREQPDKYAALQQRVHAALVAADAVLFNGQKKKAYVISLYDAAGSSDIPPLLPVPMCLPIADGPVEVSRQGPVHGIMSGYDQPWMRAAEGVSALQSAIDEGLLHMTTLTGQHRAVTAQRRNSDHRMDRTVQLPLQPYRLFVAALRRCDLALDVFAPNVERHYAMVTRTVVAVCAGLPVIHPEFTEVGPLIAEADAGWVLDPDDPQAVQDAIQEAHDDRDRLAARAQAAHDLAASTFDPFVAVAPLVEWYRQEVGRP